MDRRRLRSEEGSPGEPIRIANSTAPEFDQTEALKDVLSVGNLSFCDMRHATPVAVAPQYVQLNEQEPVR